MAINSYSTLKTAIAEWMDRTDISASKLSDIVQLAEAGLNRELRMVETDVTLTGTVGSRSVNIAAYDIIDPVAVFLVDTTLGREIELVERGDGTFPYITDNGKPSIWTIDGDNINFDCQLDSDYSFRFRYRGKFALSDSVTTNQLLEDHPDVYLAACIVWGGLYVADDAAIQKWASLLGDFVRGAKHRVAQLRRGQLLVDPALAYGAGNQGTYRW